MPALTETIGLEISLEGASVASAGKALDDLAVRFRKGVQSAFADARGTTGGALGGGFGASAGQALGGSTGAAVGQLAGTFGGQALGAAIGGAAQGFGSAVRALPPALATSGTAVAAYGGLGAAQGAIDATIGKIPIIGDIVSSQMNAFSQAIRVPHDRAAATISGIVGEAARYGVKFSDAQIDAAGAREAARERAAYQESARAERRVHAVALKSGTVAFGLSQLGL